MHEIKPPLIDGTVLSAMRTTYRAACLEGKYVKPNGTALIDYGVKTNMHELGELCDLAKALGTAECEEIITAARSYNQRKQAHATRRLAFTALALSVLSLLLSAHPVL